MAPCPIAPVPAILAATAPQDVLGNDLYDRTPARQWARGPIVLVGDAAHPRRPHLGQGGCQALEDAAILADVLDLRPALLSAAAARVTALVPEAVLTHHLEAVAARSAFQLPDDAPN